MIDANRPELTSWLSVSQDSDFPIQNLPFGVFSTPSAPAVCGTRVGDFAVGLDALQRLGYLEGLGLPVGLLLKTT